LAGAALIIDLLQVDPPFTVRFKLTKLTSSLVIAGNYAAIVLRWSPEASVVSRPLVSVSQLNLDCRGRRLPFYCSDWPVSPGRAKGGARCHMGSRQLTLFSHFREEGKWLVPGEGLGEKDCVEPVGRDGAQTHTKSEILYMINEAVRRFPRGNCGFVVSSTYFCLSHAAWRGILASEGLTGSIITPESGFFWAQIETSYSMRNRIEQPRRRGAILSSILANRASKKYAQSHY
jgi:hypothetical protein